jgi:hypothetical protein
VSRAACPSSPRAPVRERLRLGPPTVADVLILLATGALITGSIGATLAFFTRDLRLRRRLRAMAPEPIATAREGHLIKIVGRLAPASEPLTAPVSGRPCVYYHVWTEVLRTVLVQGARVREWGPGPEVSEACDFLVADDTGTALVRILPGRLPEVVLRADAYTHAIDEDGQRTHEGLLEAGNTVAVFGVGHREVDSRTEPIGYRDAPARLVLASTDQIRLIISAS